MFDGNSDERKIQERMTFLFLNFVFGEKVEYCSNLADSRLDKILFSYVFPTSVSYIS